MAKISSKEVTVNTNQNEVFDFLSDLNNLHHLMPQDKIEGWESDGATCSFKIKNLARIGLAFDKEKSTAEHMVMNAHGKVPFPFVLHIFSKENGASTLTKMEFDGEMNAMLLMMAKTPLTNFFNMLADGLERHFA